MTYYIGSGDFFLIAEAVLSQRRGLEGHSARDLARSTSVPRLLSALDAPKAAIEDVELYPTLALKAAVLCVRIARNRPLPYDNSAVALIVMREFIARNNAHWTPPPGGDDEVVAVVEAMANGTIFQAGFALWVNERMAS